MTRPRTLVLSREIDPVRFPARFYHLAALWGAAEAAPQSITLVALDRTWRAACSWPRPAAPARG
jgi:hypothetical protein